MKTYFLDTETTGLDPAKSRIVEIAIVDENGNTVIDTLVNPLCVIPGESIAVHGITNGKVGTAPTLDDLLPEIYRLLEGQKVVIYNAEYDRYFFPNHLNGSEVLCAMKPFVKEYGEWNQYRGDYKWQPLDKAVKHIGYEWEGDAHRALADSLACRAVWNWLKAKPRPQLRRVV